MQKILLIEDDLPLSGMVIAYLEAENFHIEHSSTAEDGLKKLSGSAFNVLIVDWNLPDKPGLELIRQFREQGGRTPVLFLTGRNATSDKLEAFASGADDYLTKPFDIQELQARIQALLRRPEQLLRAKLQVQDLLIDIDSHQVFKNNTEVFLMPKEFELLHFLMRQPDRVFSSKVIIAAIWANESTNADHAFRQCLTRLRKKIDPDNKNPLIRNIHGVGYKIASQPLRDSNRSLTDES